eukprot:CAMPEP_0176491724 /NCGR_PEP_ID=MMETSP0200_2-20121128/8588_1 /TAXON_ID=947934 /ORGANISM="Chaetoceros sp., Strain GSL56" /LENGTH=376 /DNA_ID=CAMNT_0017889179 /DNA_START=275 /DNA_END=1402 /DNA_ORIENTATION=+
MKLGFYFIHVAITVMMISIINMVSLVVWAHVFFSKITKGQDQQQKQGQGQGQAFSSSFWSATTLITQNDTDRGRHVGDPLIIPLLKPKVVWLMSFPNSGNSFTTQMVRMHTNHFTATNYGDEHIGENGTSVPIHHDPIYANGPFLSESITKARNIGNLVLTKTHCGGRCSRCGPETYMETLESFQAACLTARRGNSLDGKVITFEKVQYNESLVHGAIHIMRDPFDNIVSRFHLIQKVNKKLGDTKFEKTFPNNVHGFRKWCNYMDKLYLNSEEKLLNGQIFDVFQSIPCHSDFYRYIQWHNLALQVTQVMDIPSIVAYYEDYGHDFNVVKDRILSFIDLKDEGYRNVTFASGKNYRNYFTDNERGAVQRLFHLLA